MRNTTPLFLLLATVFACAASNVHAQTYFYLDEIEVVPTAPTDQLAVQLRLTGDLSNTGSSITSATAHVTGFTIGLAVGATSVGGLDMLVPHTEVVDVGVLPAGNYTITIAGPGIQDSAPQNQHHFTVTGSASTCDSLILASLTWMPFSDTALLVHVFNPTTTLFNYPGFVLLADNGDTLAKETVSTFGIGQDNYNTLNSPSGTTMPASPFNATLQLWTGFYQQLGCSWDLPVDLCPPGSCSPVVLELRNLGSGAATGSFLYTVRDAGTTVASGSFLLTDQQQYVADTVCIPPGHYLMEIIPEQGPDGGQLTFGVGLTPMITGPHAPVIWTTLSAVAFSFYENCIDVGQGITGPSPSSALHITRTTAGMELSSADSRALGDIHVFDAQGRTIARVSEPNGRHEFITAGWAPGLYLIRTTAADRQVLTVRWIVDQ